MSALSLAAGKKLAVYVEGNNAETVRSQILQAVPKSVEVVDPEVFSEALKKAGHKGPMGNAIAIGWQRKKILTSVRKALETSKIDGAIVARTRKGKGQKDEVYVLYVDPIPGDLAVDEAVPLEGGEGDRVAALKSALGGALGQLGPADAAEPTEQKPDEKKDEPAKKDEPDDDQDDGEPSEYKPHRFATALVHVTGGFELGGRFFSYSASPANTQNNRDYDIFGAPVLFIEGEIFPAATLGIPVASDVGIVGGYGRALGVSSETDDGVAFGTTWQRFFAGLRLRQRIGGGDKPFVIGVSGRFGITQFTFEPDGAPAEAIKGEVASVKYTYIRPAIDARLPIGPAAILASVGYIAVLNAGEVYDRYATDTNTKGTASIAAIDLSLGFGIELTTGLEARLLANYARYGYSFEPEVGDPYVAGGALDQMLGIQAGVGFAY
jgi:hypothetical protein